MIEFEDVDMSTEEILVDEPGDQIKAERPEIIGKWEHIGMTDTLGFEFFAEGTFHYLYLFDNKDIRNVSGKYSLDNDNKLALENSNEKSYKLEIEDEQFISIWIEDVEYFLLKKDEFALAMKEDAEGNTIDLDYIINDYLYEVETVDKQEVSNIIEYRRK